MNEPLKSGDIAYYAEDGSVIRVKLLEYSNDGHEESAKVEVLEIQAQPRLGNDCTVGEVFNVWHVIDSGAWSGDWSLRR